MRIYQVSLDVVASVCELTNRVQQHDKDLAQQMRRACTSVPLNMQEGLYSRGGSRVARFHDAMGSAKETMACLHVCVAASYLGQAQVEADLAQLHFHLRLQRAVLGLRLLLGARALGLDGRVRTDNVFVLRCRETGESVLRAAIGELAAGVLGEPVGQERRRVRRRRAGRAR